MYIYCTLRCLCSWHEWMNEWMNEWIPLECRRRRRIDAAAAVRGVELVSSRCVAALAADPRRRGRPPPASSTETTAWTGREAATASQHQCRQTTVGHRRTLVYRRVPTLLRCRSKQDSRPSRRRVVVLARHRSLRSTTQQQRHVNGLLGLCNNDNNVRNGRDYSGANQANKYTAYIYTSIRLPSVVLRNRIEKLEPKFNQRAELVKVPDVFMLFCLVVCLILFFFVPPLCIVNI